MSGYSSLTKEEIIEKKNICIRFFDIHAHLNFPDFDVDRKEVVGRAGDAGVAVINVGADKESSEKAVELAEQNDNMWASVGLHPNDAEEFDYDFYKKLALNKKVVAIGECGLDFYRAPKNQFKKQEEIFIKQIELANEVNKPLMLHIRRAYEEAYEILKTHAKVKCNLHFFAGTLEDAKKFLELGFYFSFTGVITFARNYDEIIRFLPIDKIMSETDCPFVAPEPFRGKRNEPAYVVEVVKKIAEIRGEDFEKVRAQLLSNARIFFCI
jgi:TatD DNase family protein